jgi:hypothetical protein
MSLTNGILECLSLADTGDNYQPVMFMAQLPAEVVTSCLLRDTGAWKETVFSL